MRWPAKRTRSWMDCFVRPVPRSGWRTSHCCGRMLPCASRDTLRIWQPKRCSSPTAPRFALGNRAFPLSSCYRKKAVLGWIHPPVVVRRIIPLPCRAPTLSSRRNLARPFFGELRQPLPAVHRSIQFAVDREIGTLVRVFCRQRLVDLHSHSRCIARVHRPIFKSVVVRKDAVGLIGVPHVFL